MKFRIVPCIKSKVRYKIQVKSWFFWSNLVDVRDYGYGAIHSVLKFDTIKEAAEYAEKRYGTSSRHVEFEVRR